MSEHFGDAFIFVRPDATKFREELIAQLEAATKGVKVVVPVAGLGGATGAKASAQSRELAKAHKVAGAAAADLTAQEASLAKATAAQAAATEAAAKVEGADALTTSELAGAKAKLRAANVALVAAQKANTLALATENAELRANAASSLAAAEAELATARAAAIEAAAHARASGEIAAHSAAHHALAKGAAATGLSLVGARGATLAASSAFLAGAAAVTIFEHAIHEASAETEAAARADRVFGDSAHELERDARGLADSFGISTKAALQFEGRLGTIFKNAGFANEESAHLSEGLTKLAGDLAAFNDVPTDKVLNAIAQALLGNARGLKVLNIELNSARVNQLALTDSGKKHINQLTQEEKVRARVKLLIQSTTVAQGAAQRRAEGLAQGEKELKANLENLGGTLGRAVIPKVTELVHEGTLLVGVFQHLSSGAEDLATVVGGSEFGKAVGVLNKFLNPLSTSPFEKFKEAKGIFHTLFPPDLNRPLELLDENGKKVSVTFEELHRQAEEKFRIKSLAELTDNLDKAIDRAKKLARAAADVNFNNAASSLDRVKERMDDIKIAGGTAGDELANLEQQAAAARAKVAAAVAEADITRGGTGHDTAVQRRREAKGELVDILGQIEANRKDQAQAAQDVADKIKQIVEDAKQRVQDAIDAANQSFLDTIELLARPFEIKQLRVEATKSLEDDVQFQKDLQVNIRKQIAIASKIIADEKLRAATIHDLTVQLVQSRIAEKALEDQRKQNALDRKKAQQDAKATSLDLDIDFAQTTKNRTAELRAHQAKIKFLTDLQSHTKRGTNEWKKLRNEIAQERAAIKGLRGDLDKQRADLLALQFEFLQAQSGFAANVLSNILPTSTLAGTVGGGISTPTSPGRNPAVPPAGFATGVHTRDSAAKGSAASQASRGASSGQMSTLINIQRQTLQLIGRLVGARAHPEATHQRVTEAASMDIINW